MAMFSRRSLQRLLNDLKGRFPFEARQKLARELDRQSASALGYEWELALLTALGHVGHVEYEAESSAGTRRPDILFAEADDGPIHFIADVATVSDAGLEAENPVMRFSQALHRLKRKCKLPGSLYYDIKGEAAGRSYHDRKMRLKLPKAAELDQFLEAQVGPEFRRIHNEKLTGETIAVNQPGIEFYVKYSDNPKHGGGSYPSYTAAYSKTRNPVYSALKAKIAQLKKSGSTYPFGIFLCDGGCALLGKTQRSAADLSVDAVISEFFRQYSSVAFVVILVFPPTRAEPFSGIIKELKITGRLYLNPRAENALPADRLIALINRGLAQLPPPTATPRDALHRLARLEAHQGRTIATVTHGGGMMSQSIKISARKVQELLAGKMTPDELFSDFRRPGETFENPFLTALNRGLTMEAVAITKVSNGDDDLLEIHFGLADPAISKFTVSE